MAKKTVLIIDESDLFREYLKESLERFSFTVETAINGLDGISKMRTVMPDAIILDYHLSRASCEEVLEEKNKNPNTAKIPVLLTAQKIDKNKLLGMMHYNIRKAFMKPIRLDSLYQTLAESLGIKIDVDKTPCIVDAHVNDNIVFVEIAKGLNLDKIELLRFKIAELLALYEIKDPRVLVMLADMELSFVDAPNIEKLLDAVLEASQARTRHVKILTNQAFAREFVEGRPKYSGIEAVNDLRLAMDGLLAEYDPGRDSAATRDELISSRILAAPEGPMRRESVQTRFESERPAARSTPLSSIKDSAKDLKIAVVDDDFVIQELVRTTFQAIDAKVFAYSDGSSFLAAAPSEDFDIAFLDILMPGLDGFAVMNKMNESDLELPIIVLSAVTRREAVVKAFQAGCKSYLIKPLKPDLILRKTLEILKANF
jgi:DNA-binding response OmpR family regulator